MLIRSIEEKDLDRISDLYASVFSSTPWNEPWSFEEARHRLEHIFQSKGFIGLLVELEESVEAIVLGNAEPFLSEETFNLREMCVNPKQQGNGVGQRLIQQLHLKLKELDISGVYLTTRNELKAASFYTKNGYSLEKDQGIYEIRFNS